MDDRKIVTAIYWMMGILFAAGLIVGFLVGHFL